MPVTCNRQLPKAVQSHCKRLNQLLQGAGLPVPKQRVREDQAGSHRVHFQPTLHFLRRPAQTPHNYNEEIL